MNRILLLAYFAANTALAVGKLAIWLPDCGDVVGQLNPSMSEKFTSLNPEVTEIDTIYALKTYTILFEEQPPDGFKWTTRVDGVQQLVKSTPVTKQSCITSSSLSVPKESLVVTGPPDTSSNQGPSPTSDERDVKLITTPASLTPSPTCHSMGRGETDTYFIIYGAMRFCGSLYSSSVRTLTLPYPASYLSEQNIVRDGLKMVFQVGSNVCARSIHTGKKGSDSSSLIPFVPPGFAADWVEHNQFVWPCMEVFWNMWRHCE